MDPSDDLDGADRDAPSQFESDVATIVAWAFAAAALVLACRYLWTMIGE